MSTQGCCLGRAVTEMLAEGWWDSGEETGTGKNVVGNREKWRKVTGGGLFVQERLTSEK